MSVTRVDADWEHLFPAFREKLRQVLTTAPKGPWRIAEGYRSPERQTFLYAQGRTRPGPIVTWMRYPKSHGTGLAADVVPAAGYDAPRSTWEGLRAVYLRHGLENPAWAKGDLGHVQWPARDEQTNEEARDWCEAGFPLDAVYEAVPVFLRGQKIIDGEMRPGQVWAPLRPLADALGLRIFEVTAEAALVGLTVPRQGVQVPLRIDGGKGYSPVRLVAEPSGFGVQLTARGVEIA